MTSGEGGRFRRVFRLPFTRTRLARVIDDELRFHIEERIREFEARGMTPDQARVEVMRRFGDYDSYSREAKRIDEATIRTLNRTEMLNTVLRELRHASATLLRSPSFSAIALVTLALGLGATTAIFTLLDRVVLRPLPYPNAERLVHVGTLWPGVRADAEFALSRGQFFYFKDKSRTLANIGLYDTDMLPIPGDGSHPAERVRTLFASTSLFSVLGIAPERGRLFTADEGIPRRRTVAVLSHGYWQRRFGGDEHIVGKRLVLGDSLGYDIIGVLPPGANVPDFKADIWIPNWLDPAQPPQNNHTHFAIALARPGVSTSAVAEELKRLQKQFEQAWPDVYPQKFLDRTGFVLNVSSLHERVVGSKIARALWILFGAVAFVLLIAAANVANLFLVRIDARRREVALRKALGAGNGQLAVHYLTESVLLALAAAAGAVVMGYMLLKVVVALAPEGLPRLEEISLDWRSVAFCTALAMLSAIVFGLLPLGSADADVNMLREGARGLTSSRGRNAARRTLVVAQVALAVALFSGAMLMAKSYSRLRDVRPGFDAAGVVSMSIQLPYARTRTVEQRSSFWRQLSDRIGVVPGVVGAGGTEQLPLIGQSGCSVVKTDVPDAPVQCVPTTVVTPGYFAAMGIRVRGREPDWSLTESGIGPVVVSKAFADQFFGDRDPIGRGVKINSDRIPFFQIVGVAEDVRANGLQKPPVNAVYFPVVPPKALPAWEAGYGLAFVVRAPSMSTAQVFNAVRRAVQEIDPSVPVDEPLAMEIVVSRSMAQTSFTMMLLMISASIALLLSAVGLYGVVSYMVAHRRAEIGIRMALGARVGEVTTMVLSQSLALATMGIIGGVVIALLGTKLMQSLLFEVSANDPAVLALASVALVSVAALASFAPARRAARVDPVEALRSS